MNESNSIPISRSSSSKGQTKEEERDDRMKTSVDFIGEENCSLAQHLTSSPLI